MITHIQGFRAYPHVPVVEIDSPPPPSPPLYILAYVHQEAGDGGGRQEQHLLEDSGGGEASHLMRHWKRATIYDPLGLEGPSPRPENISYSGVLRG